MTDWTDLELRTLELRPDQTLVVQLADGTPLDVVRAIRQRVIDVTGHERVLVTSQSVALSVIDPKPDQEGPES
jgi:hypothetical protein